MTRSGDLALIAAGVAGRVGIDVERIHDGLATEEMVRSVLSHVERETLPADPQERAFLFFRFWTRKEAYAKATGHGLALPMREINFATAGDDQLVLSAGPAASAGRVRDLEPVPGYVGALARLDVGRAPIEFEEGWFIPSR